VFNIPGRRGVVYMQSRILLTLLLVITFVACSPTEKRTPVSAGELEGTKWQLISYGPADNSIDALEGDLVTVEFDNFEDMHGETGCNYYAKNFEIDDFRLITDELQRTRFDCSNAGVMAQDGAVLGALKSVSAIGLEEEFLVIDYEGGTLRFIKEPPPPVTPLTGTSWQLVAMSQGTELVPLLPGTLITANFEEGQMQGGSGCNSYGAEYIVEGSNFSTGEIEQTAELCLDKALMEQEKRFINGLMEATGYQLEGETLIIDHPDGEFHFQQANSLSEAPFVGTIWRLSAFLEEGKQRLPVEGADITILFGGVQYSGSTGCNQFSGEYAIEGNNVRPGGFFVTEKECPSPEIMEQERHFLNILRRNHNLMVGVSDEELLLVDDDGALLFTALGKLGSAANQSAIEEWLAVYENPYLEVSLSYTANWTPDPDYVRPQAGARFAGEDGYFMLTKVSYGGGTADIAVEAEINSPLNAYGTSPTIESVEIDCQPGRLIWPAEDQPADMNDQAALVLRYPERSEESDDAVEFLVLYADRDHLPDLLQNLHFHSLSNGDKPAEC
jgi:heat shock protein HslJ